MHTDQMSTSETVFANHPSIGFIASIMGILTPFITSILPVFQLLLVTGSLIICLLTIEAKVKERKIKRQEEKRKKK